MNDEEKSLTEVAVQNIVSIEGARRRAEEELVAAKRVLEDRSRELLRSLARTRAILEATTDAILAVDTKGNITDFNQRAVKMWDLSIATSEEDRPKWFEQIASKLKHPDRYLAEINSVIQGMPAETFGVWETLDGRFIEQITGLQITPDGVGNEGHAWCFRDITEHMRVNEALRRSENRKSAILASVMDAIITIDHEGTILDFNLAAENILGHKAQYAVGKSVAELIVPERLRRHHNEGLARYVRTLQPRILGKRVELAALHADGHEFTAELSINHIPGTNPPMFTGTIRDITEIKLGLEIKTRLAAIIESSQDAIIGKTLDGIVTTWNPGAERILGYAASEMIGQSIKKIVPNELHNEETTILERLRRGESVDELETKRVTKSGRIIDVSISSSPILDIHGNVIGASKRLRDITARKQAEETLRRGEMETRAASERAAAEREQLLKAERSARATAERMSAIKDEFLATLSHELRTPLSAILGWAHLLQRPSKNPTALADGLAAIERNARIQAKLIEDLLDMSRIIAGKIRLDVQPLQPITVIEAAIETVRPAAEAKAVRLEKILDPGAGPISGDPGRLQQVIWNLLSNAVKFTPKGGKVQIMLSRVNSHIEIMVADTGIGIAPDFIDHIFERFRQGDASTARAYGGLGLGLAIVKDLVELHGGNIRVISEGQGQGAAFYVELPVTVVHSQRYYETRVHPQSEHTTKNTFSHPTLTGLQVLVVDDEADSCELVKRILEDCGAEVKTATSAAMAFKIVENTRLHVLISDVGLPGIDGYELLRQIRALSPDKGGRIPAIALTAFARSEDRMQALHAGFIAHIAKPADPSELAATVASVTHWVDTVRHV